MKYIIVTDEEGTLLPEESCVIGDDGKPLEDVTAMLIKVTADGLVPTISLIRLINIVEDPEDKTAVIWHSVFGKKEPVATKKPADAPCNEVWKPVEGE